MIEKYGLKTKPHEMIRSTQVIIVTLISLLLVFGGIATVIGKQAPQPASIISNLGVGMAAFLVLMRFTVPNLNAMRQLSALRRDVESPEPIRVPLPRPFQIYPMRLAILLALAKLIDALNWIAILVVIHVGFRCVIYFVLRNIPNEEFDQFIESDDLKQELPERLAPIFQAKVILGAGLLMGATLFNLVCFIIDDRPISIAIVGLLTVLIMLMFPTLAQFEHWVENIPWAEDIRRDLRLKNADQV